VLFKKGEIGGLKKEGDKVLWENKKKKKMGGGLGKKGNVIQKGQ